VLPAKHRLAAFVTAAAEVAAFDDQMKGYPVATARLVSDGIG
jgi:hypothetical protein